MRHGRERSRTLQSREMPRPPRARPERFIASANTIVAVYAWVANWSGSAEFLSLKAFTKSALALSVDALFHAVPTIMFGAAAPAAVITAAELNPFEPTTRSPCGN